jgi:subtilisin family serine protease
MSLQMLPPWGLDRSDTREGVDGRYTYNRTGRGVHVFVLDTGLYGGHSDFDRLGQGTSVFDPIQPWHDCDGHGTHVAGTVAGRVHGMAKDATLHSVKVMGGACPTPSINSNSAATPPPRDDVFAESTAGSEGTAGTVSAGLQWVREQTQLRPAVALVCLGGDRSKTVDTAVVNLVHAGVVVVAAAGNRNGSELNAAVDAQTLTLGQRKLRLASADLSPNPRLVLSVSCCQHPTTQYQASSLVS